MQTCSLSRPIESRRTNVKTNRYLYIGSTSLQLSGTLLTVELLLFQTNPWHFKAMNRCIIIIMIIIIFSVNDNLYNAVSTRALQGRLQKTNVQ